MNSSSEEERPPPVASISKPTTDVEQLLGVANQHFIFQEFDKAVEILHEVIRKAPGLPDPYHVLGLIHDEKKEHEKAVNFYFLAAQITQHDADLWAKVANLHKELGHLKDAVYCFSRALLNKKQPDLELMKEK